MYCNLFNYLRIRWYALRPKRDNIRALDEIVLSIGYTDFPYSNILLFSILSINLMLFVQSYHAINNIRPPICTLSQTVVHSVIDPSIWVQSRIFCDFSVLYQYALFYLFTCTFFKTLTYISLKQL